MRKDDKRFKSFLKYISDKELKSKEDYAQAISEVEKVYSDGYRHPYSLITAYILEDTRADDRDEILGSLSQNVLSIINQIENRKKDKNASEKKVDEELMQKLQKLRDHINLESIHLIHYGNEISKLQEVVADLEQKTKKIKTNLKNQQNQYITILGIFASIVLAFVGGFTFSTSVFANIGESSIYRLVFVMVFIACFVTNILYYLFGFIKNLNIENPESIFKDKAIISFNAIMLLVLICDGAIYCIISLIK